MKKKLTKRKQGRVSVHSGQVEFVKVNVGGWQWRDVYQLLLGLRWPQFAALVGAFYITLNLLFATLYAVDPNSIAGTTGGRWFYDCFFFSVQTLATVGYGSERLLAPDRPDDPSNRRVEIRDVGQSSQQLQ